MLNTRFIISHSGIKSTSFLVYSLFRKEKLYKLSFVYSIINPGRISEGKIKRFIIYRFI